MNPIRIQFIREQIATVEGRESFIKSNQLSGLKVLDVGCGGKIKIVIVTFTFHF